ncbi:MAG: class I SAM-dependent methyltransferase [Clostridiales bacterium]|nr:class I SAM-dependent methyltransferase [Clostridiales bacterium]
MSNYGNFANVYDVLTESIDYDSLVKRIKELIPPVTVSGGHLLDLGCGTGIISFLLSDAGYDVIGIDSSPDMLSVASGKNSSSDAGILFLCQNLAELDLFGTAKAAVCCMDTLNHIDSMEDIKSFFRRLSLFLEMNSLFLFDMNTPYKHEEILADNTFVYDMDDVYCIWQNEYDEGLKRTSISMDFFARNENGLFEKSSDSFYEYAYEPEEIKKALLESGFDICGIYDEYSDLPPVNSSQRISILAKKSRLIDSGEIK